MATVTRENIGLLNEKIVVKVAKDDYFPSFEKAMKDYSKKANIPGFRKGMVPVGMVKKMYGSSVFADEVIKSVEKGLSDYMGSEKLDIFAQPLPLQENAPSMDMNQPSEYAFAFEIGLKPEFNIAQLSGANLTRYKVTVTEEMISEEVDYMLDRQAIVTNVEAVESEDAELNTTFTETDADGNIIEGGIVKDVLLTVKKFSPSFREQVSGKKTADELLLRLSQAFDETEKEWINTELGISKDDVQAGDKFFKLNITNISTKNKPELNEAFFKQVFPDKDVLTEEDFRNELRNQIQAQWDNVSLNQLHDQLYHELLNHTEIEFPADFLKRWMVTSSEKPKTKEEVEKEFPTFSNQLKWTLIIDKITHDNHIEVSEDDIRMLAKHQLLGYMGGQVMDIEQPWINDYVERMMKDKKFAEDSYHRIRTEKVFAWAVSHFQPSEVAISVEDFKKLQEAHKHHH